MKKRIEEIARRFHIEERASKVPMEDVKSYIELQINKRFTPFDVDEYYQALDEFFAPYMLIPAVVTFLMTLNRVICQNMRLMA